MLRVWLSACVVPAVVCIIVTDYPPTSTEYSYSYNVINPSTGDAKSIHEVKQGDTVTGSYSLIDPDGIRRTVKYTAGPHIGFKAVVHNEPETPEIPSHNPHIGYQPFVGRLTAIPYVHKLSPGPVYLPVPKKTNRFFTPDVTRVVKPALDAGEYFVPNKSYQSNRI